MAPWLASYSPVPKASPSSTPPWAWINLSGITAGIGSNWEKQSLCNLNYYVDMWISELGTSVSVYFQLPQRCGIHLVKN